MRGRLIILSDLWGNTNAEWIAGYNDALKDQFDITYYDSQELAQIDPKLNQESDIHSAFVHGGIERAIENLCSLEKEKVTILAFSIGGTIAWGAALKGLKVKALYALSSTRLRHESEQPKCKIMLFYGEKDPNKPDQTWFEQQEIVPFIFEGMDHEMYKGPTIINRICDHLKLDSKND